jgi:short-subunit dehydrogenase
MQRYLITGASRGIGRAIAERLAAKDRHLMLHGRDRAALNETAALVKAKGAEASIHVYDLSDAAELEALVRVASHDPITALINNAGLGLAKQFGEMTLAEWSRLLQVNVTAPFRLIQGIAPLMKPGASIVNILSISAKIAFPNWSGYTASKFAFDGFSKCVREELRSHGIRVINLYPASTDTDIWDDIGGDWPRKKMMPAVQVAEAIAFAIERPGDVLVEDITLGNVAGRL